MSVGDKQSGLMADINVTPLVDVVLVLLIIFMVVTPMLSSGVDVDLPDAESSTTVNDAGQHVVVSIRSDAAIFVDTKRSSLDKVVDDLNAEWRKDPNRALLIKGDKTLRWKDVHNVMAKVNDNGMSSMLLAAEKSSGGSSSEGGD
ncbi:MAG: biopolymer transporter ExbD [Alphaproteobacteria bacterium]|nr:biopolymer transporter ExbD [Alphaproteobacteria bacterium]